MRRRYDTRLKVRDSGVAARSVTFPRDPEPALSRRKDGQGRRVLPRQESYQCGPPHSRLRSSFTYQIRGKPAGACVLADATQRGHLSGVRFDLRVFLLSGEVDLATPRLNTQLINLKCKSRAEPSRRLPIVRTRRPQCIVPQTGFKPKRVSFFFECILPQTKSSPNSTQSVGGMGRPRCAPRSVAQDAQRKRSWRAVATPHLSTTMGLCALIGDVNRHIGLLHTMSCSTSEPRGCGPQAS